MVEQGEHDMTTSTIATYGLSSCYFLLLDGYYDDGGEKKSFAYLNHHGEWIDPDTLPPIEIIDLFLNEIVKFLKKYGPKILKLKNGSFSIEKISNVQLVIGGSRKVIIDPIKDAFSLLTGSNDLIDEIKPLLNKKYLPIIHQLKNNIIIYDGFTYLTTNVEDELGEGKT